MWFANYLSTRHFDNRFNIGHRSSITSLWTNSKCHLRLDHYFLAWDQWWIFTLCLYVDWEQCVHMYILSTGLWIKTAMYVLASFFQYMTWPFSLSLFGWLRTLLLTSRYTSTQVSLTSWRLLFFNGSTGFGYKFKEYYVSLHPDLKELELTIPIVALSATAVSLTFYGCLHYCWLRHDDTSSLWCSINGVKEKKKKWALTARRAKLRNSKVRISRRSIITT